MEDAIIVQELAKQNVDAFDWLFEKYYTRMVAHAHIILQDEEEAKDVVQELIIRLLEFNGWHKVLDLRSYLTRAAHNNALHRVAELKRIAVRNATYGQTLEHASQEASPVQLLRDEHFLRQKILYLLSLLSPQRRQAFILVYVRGCSYGEAAEIMGIAKNTIKTHLKLGMKSLRHTILRLILLFFMVSN